MDTAHHSECSEHFQRVNFIAKDSLESPESRNTLKHKSEMKFILNSRSQTLRCSLIHFLTQGIRSVLYIEQSSRYSPYSQPCGSFTAKTAEKTRQNLEIVWGLRSGDSLDQIGAKWKDFNDFLPSIKTCSSAKYGTGWEVDDPLGLPNCSCGWHIANMAKRSARNKLKLSINNY